MIGTIIIGIWSMFVVALGVRTLNKEQIKQHFEEQQFEEYMQQVSLDKYEIGVTEALENK